MEYGGYTFTKCTMWSCQGLVEGLPSGTCHTQSGFCELDFGLAGVKQLLTCNSLLTILTMLHIQVKDAYQLFMLSPFRVLKSPFILCVLCLRVSRRALEHVEDDKLTGLDSNREINFINSVGTLFCLPISESPETRTIQGPLKPYFKKVRSEIKLVPTHLHRETGFCPI